jgi:phosphotransferase system enzyme I (PtsP)
MGWRALRLALDRSTLMKAQSRALLEAAAGRELDVMFPMISEPWEFDEAKALVEEQRVWLGQRKKRLPTHVRYGAMMEVPALAECLDLLLPKIDFLSIGTNDLTQFLFAADRSNPKLAERYDWLSPAILRFLRRIVRAGGRGQGPACRVRRDGRAHAGGDGADRHRRTPAVDHPGRGGAAQGDDPLARPRRHHRR